MNVDVPKYRLSDDQLNVVKLFEYAMQENRLMYYAVKEISTGQVVPLLFMIVEEDGERLIHPLGVLFKPGDDPLEDTYDFPINIDDISSEDFNFMEDDGDEPCDCVACEVGEDDEHSESGEPWVKRIFRKIFVK